MAASVAGAREGLGGTELDAVPLDTVVVVETPEHVRFRHTLAGPSRRALAYALDTVCRAVVLGLVATLTSIGHFAHDGMSSGFASGAVWVVAFVLEWAYFVLFETLWDGQSPGKWALGLRVVSASGRPLGFVDSVLRNLLRAADFLPTFYALGFVSIAVDSRFRRLGDMVGGTLVIADQRQSVDAPLHGLARPSEAELRQIPHELALLPHEVEAVELFLRRRGSLSESRAEELAAIAARVVARGARLPSLPASRLLEVLYFNALARGGLHGASRAVA
jgi:uncharacterized RDD family membrane protein YckC